MENEVREIKFTHGKTIFPVLFAISFSHLLNDTMQSLIPAIYPLIKTGLNLSFAQVGLITLTFQLSASILQPIVGFYTDKKPKPYSLAAGMGFTLSGLLLLSFSGVYAMVLASVGLVGIGSSIFHPEASRVAYLASGGKRGTAQSIFQVGGNAGSSLGPLLAAVIIVPYGKGNVRWFSMLALIAMMVLTKVGGWYKKNLKKSESKAYSYQKEENAIPRKKIIFSIIILLILIFSKYFYMVSLTSYYTFYLIDKFKITVQSSQVHLFIFLAALAAGTLIGGPLGDRFGRKYIIWFSILGSAPFTLLMPHANLVWTTILTLIIGLILASAFPAILVYAQELLPGKIGMIAGLFFGFAFGMAGIGSAFLGWLADITSINFVYQICSFLPLIGLLTGFLPNIETKKFK
ncbi:MAG TPA: MFS transporter [Ignavibacteriaceae bacterium]|nr:MFS transporter [Ignavibacteriaceae bacterium]